MDKLDIPLRSEGRIFQAAFRLSLLIHQLPASLFPVQKGNERLWQVLTMTLRQSENL
jgi:hypothetical protein